MTIDLEIEIEDIVLMVLKVLKWIKELHMVMFRVIEIKLN